ncbi:MAG: hypothetical protein QXW70_03610 [Candidatus Anstonellales archaeon]
MVEVLLIPFGWFSVWVGLERLFYGGKKTKRQLELAQKLSRTQYLFIS